MLIGERSGDVKVAFHESDFWSDFRVFGFLRFGFTFGPGDWVVHSQHPFGACEHLCDSSGGDSRPDFLTFLVHMVVGFVV